METALEVCCCQTWRLVDALGAPKKEEGGHCIEPVSHCCCSLIKFEGSPTFCRILLTKLGQPCTYAEQLPSRPFKPQEG